MGLLDEVFADVAQTLIGEFSDTPATITRTTQDYDPETGEESGAVTQEVAAKTSPPSPFALRDINGTNILQGDVTVLVASADLGAFVPSHQTDTLTRGGITYRIVSVEPISSGDSIAAYQLHCRR